MSSVELAIESSDTKTEACLVKRSSCGIGAVKSCLSNVAICRRVKMAHNIRNDSAPQIIVVLQYYLGKNQTARHYGLKEDTRKKQNQNALNNTWQNYQAN